MQSARRNLKHKDAPVAPGAVRRSEGAVSAAVLLDLEHERTLEPILGVGDLEMDNIDVDQALFDGL